MKSKKKVTIEIEENIEIECDVCKKSFTLDRNVDEYDPISIQEFLHLEFTGGYGSIFGDGHIYEADICQKCVKQKLGKYLRKIGEV